MVNTQLDNGYRHHQYSHMNVRPNSTYFQSLQKYHNLETKPSGIVCVACGTTLVFVIMLNTCRHLKLCLNHTKCDNWIMDIDTALLPTRISGQTQHMFESFKKSQNLEQTQSSILFVACWTTLVFSIILQSAQSFKAV